MATRGYEHGSAILGTIFTISVFGPMAILAAIWAVAAGAGDAGPLRDLAGQAMVWVLLVSGLVLTIDESIFLLVSLFRRPHIDWPEPRLKLSDPPPQDAAILDAIPTAVEPSATPT